MSFSAPKIQRSLLSVGALLLLLGTSQSHALTEAELASDFETKVVRFFEHGKEEYFYSRSGEIREVHYRVFQNHATRKLVVLSPGRGESAWLYAELIYDLHQAGFSVAILDHHGQGNSPQQPGLDASIQNLHSFDEYAEDFNHFLNVLKDREFPADDYHYGLLAHSAGSMIALQSILRKDCPIQFRALVFTAPMMRIRTSPLPFFLAEPFVQALTLVMGDSIAPFQKEKLDRDFNHYSESKGRRRRELLRHLHFQKTGRRGLYPSTRWAREALRVSRNVVRLRLKEPIPTLVLSPSHDLMVEPQGGAEVGKIVADHCEFYLVDRSSHDVWTEPDGRREDALKKTLLHFQKNL